MRHIFLFTAFIAIIVSPLFAQNDVPGSKDHPLITRYPGSYIDWYDQQEFERYKIAVGPVTGYRHIDDWLTVEGKVTRIYYVLEGSRSMSEVYLNYLNAVKKAGFEILAEGLHKERNVSKEIGGGNWLGVLYKENPFPTVGKINLLKGSATVGGTAYFAAKLDRPQGAAYVSLGAKQYKEDEVVVMLDVIEAKPMEADLVHVDANAMSKDIATYGKVALYGIFFDHDKATIKPESKPTLDEIAALLKKNTGLKLYVVGHTDMQGTLAYNMQLSQKRAQAVVDALVKDYGIASARLEPRGVGPLVPVFTNQNDAGRAKNRRVELVEK